MHKQATKVGIRELRANLSDLLRKVRRGGTLVVMSRNQVVAEIHPPSESRRAERKLGALKGRIRMASDFDVMPDDLVAAMENG